MAYADSADLKEALGITDDADDYALDLALESATEIIDAHCGRTFAHDLTASTRYFTADTTGRCEIDDVYTSTGLVVTSYGTTVPAAVPYVSAGYQLGPRNAEALGKPYTFITHTSGWSGALPWYGGLSTVSEAIGVTARWGYSEDIPTAIEQATLLQASRIFARRHSPYGIAGSPEVGSEVRLLSRVDPDVAVLLNPYRRMWGAR